MQTETISVIIALYNKEDYIEATIRSVLLQTMPPDEIIIADDGSTDESVARIRALVDPRIQIISTELAGSGPSVARNIAIRAASGKWLAILDADDLWEPRYIETMVRLLRQTPNAVCAFSSWLVMSSDAVLQEPCSKAVGEERIFRLAEFLGLWTKMRYCPMWTSAVVASRQALIEIGGFPESYRRGEDKDTWLRLLMHGPAAYCPQPLARYNVAVTNQVTTHFTAVDHPVAITISKVRDLHFDRRTQKLLDRLSNLVIWQYARQAVRARARIPISYIRLFKPMQNPLWYSAIAGIWTLQKIGLFDKVKKFRKSDVGAIRSNGNLRELRRP